MPSFIEHVEEYLGPIQGGGRLSDGVQAAWFADCPVPITSNEARFIHENGWPAFESLLEEAYPDLLDLSRPSIVAGGA